MFLRYLLLAAAAASVVQSSERNNFDLSLETCPDSVDHFGIKKVGIQHHAVQPGTAMDVTIEHVPTRAISKGVITLILDVEGVDAAQQSYDLCSLIDCTNYAHTPSSLSMRFDVPHLVPAGLTTALKIVVSDHLGAQISCMRADKVNVGNSPLFTSYNELSGDRLTAVDRMSKTQLAFLYTQWCIQHSLKELQFDDRSFGVFVENLRAIFAHNSAGKSTYSLHLNHFAALTLDEFSSTHFGLKPSNATKNKKFFQQEISLGVSELEKSLPSEVDWTKRGAVTPVKNQGSCGSCWAFSATGALEGAYFLKTGKLESFSEQNLVSCDHRDLGCLGGSMDAADDYIMRAGGICKESDYPYVATNSPCHTCKQVPGSTPKYAVDVFQSESSLEAAIVKRPVSVAIEADQLSFQFYRAGVLTGRCGTTLDHGVLAVGYGTKNRVDYFKVKNSWGPSYGMGGYVLIERGKPVQGGECGILLQASYPVL